MSDTPTGAAEGRLGDFWDVIAELNASSPEERLDAASRRAGRPARRRRSEEVNNHVHTTYSFSPYSPSAAVWAAREEGLSTVGIVDHDSVAGAREFRKAGEILGLPTTTGFEVRVSMAESALADGRRFNSPDGPDMAYVVCHGLPHTALEDADALLSSVRRSREERNRRMVRRLNDELAGLGVPALSYEGDVRAISEAQRGGTVTERHIMYALAQRVLREIGVGQPLVAFLREAMSLELSESKERALADPAHPNLRYELLGLFKAEFVPRVYELPDAQECISVSTAVESMRRFGAVPCYPYLGDVGESPTGDKKAQRFEDSFLDELFGELVRLGFQAVTYMPPRNTRAQLSRLQELCRAHGLMEISGVDVNAPTQSFRCPETAEPAFRHLGDAAWALIEHERAVEEGQGGLPEHGGRAAVPRLAERGRRRFADRVR
ncbi:MAG: PHP domain-containing protein [Spirochaetaceae bacterium]